MKKKTVQLNKKLIFSRTNIANLNPEEQESLAGGAITGTQNTCVVGACATGTQNTCVLTACPSLPDANCSVLCQSVVCSITKRKVTPACLPC